MLLHLAEHLHIIGFIMDEGDYPEAAAIEGEAAYFVVDGDVFGEGPQAVDLPAVPLEHVMVAWEDYGFNPGCRVIFQALGDGTKLREAQRLSVVGEVPQDQYFIDTMLLAILTYPVSGPDDIV
jgi:hypothetical protein